MEWHGAVGDVPGGSRLRLLATTGASSVVFPSGFNKWRGRIGIAVAAAAQDGKANTEILAAVAKTMGVPVRAVEIESGAQDRRKNVIVAGLPAEAARAVLARLL